MRGLIRKGRVLFLSWELRRQHRRVLTQWRPRNKIDPSLLFLCYGNICRSPISELIAHKQFGLNAFSAGFHEKEGRSSPPHIVAAAAELGVDLEKHSSRRVSRDDISRADLIVVMDLDNYLAAKRQFPHVSQRMTLLGLFGPKKQLVIRDPYLLSFEESRTVLQDIDSSICGLAEWWQSRVRGVLDISA